MNRFMLIAAIMALMLSGCGEQTPQSEINDTIDEIVSLIESGETEKNVKRICVF